MFVQLPVLGQDHSQPAV